jgi:hypothetical protein
LYEVVQDARKAVGGGRVLDYPDELYALQSHGKLGVVGGLIGVD